MESITLKIASSIFVLTLCASVSAQSNNAIAPLGRATSDAAQVDPSAQFSLMTMAQGQGAKGASEHSKRISVQDFGGKGDGVSDDTPALNAAIEAATQKSLTIDFPCGNFRFASRPKRIATGIQLVGCGSVGSNTDYGTNLLADYDEQDPESSFLEWDGSWGKTFKKCCAGSGGGIDHLAITKNSHRHGGTAIKVTGSEDNYRAGFFNINNVVVHANGDGSWEHDLIIDGTCCKTPNSQGVRDIYITDFYAAQATSGEKAILLKNSAQFFWHGGVIFPAAVSASSGITITGGEGTQYLESTNVFLSDIYTAGDLNIERARNVTFSGYIGGNLTISAAAKMVWVTGLVGGKISNKSSTATVLTSSGFQQSSAALKHRRVSVTVQAKSRSIVQVDWQPAFLDSQYTISTQIADPSGELSIINIQSQSPQFIKLQVENIDEKAPHTALIHVIAVHD